MRAALIGLALFATALPAAAQQQTLPPVTTPERQVVRPSTVVVTPPPAPAPAPAAAPSGVSRVWALPALEVGGSGSGFHCFFVTNMSMTPARISAHVVRQSGAPNAAADAEYNRQLDVVRPGHQQRPCWGSESDTFASTDGSYWLVIAATAPVAITGFTYSQITYYRVSGTNQISASYVREPIPIDCARSEGFEFACAVAEGRFPPESIVVRPR